MIRKRSGKASRTQLLHMFAAALQCVNVSVFAAAGLSAESALLIATFCAMAQSCIGIYLRTITTEPMQ